MEGLRLITAPLAYLGFEGVAIYGLFRPYEGRKQYAALEKFFYNEAMIAPCFQPNPTHHLFGSDINTPDGF